MTLLLETLLATVLFAGLLGYVLLRRRVFETTKVAIDAALASMDEGIAVLSPGGRVLFSNSAMARHQLLGASGERVPATLRGAARAEVELTFGERSFAVVTSPIHDLAGRLQGHLLLARDTTAARASERELERRNAALEESVRTQQEAFRAQASAEAANHAKSAFLANMSHELRTPLNAILGFVQLLERDQDLRPGQRDSLGIIGRSGEHLLGLINDVLEISKIEAGRMALSEGHFDLHRLLLGVEEMFGVRARRNADLTFTVISADDLPRFLFGDEGKLRQVLLNIVGNALKFTPKGQVTLRVEQGPAFDPAEPSTTKVLLYFEISDTGLGIASSEQAKLFKPFVQAESAGGAKEGTGLGLSISQAFVSLMGGDLTFSSKLGKGTTFAFHVPMRLSVAKDGGGRVRGRVVGLSPGQPVYRILVVDDQWENRELLIKLLGSVGFEARGAGDGREAVELWEAWSPQLIWMDMRMPILDGYEATKQIKSTLKGQATVVIALTASAFEHDRAMVLSVGCDDFLRKPAKEAEIFERMEKHLGIQFIYTGGNDAAPASSALSQRRSESALTPAALATLPEALRRDLRAAATQLNARMVHGIVDRIRAEDGRLADRLRALVEAYRFDTILSLLDDPSERPS